MQFVAEHDIEIELVHVDLQAKAHLEADYLAINPNGTVPFLTDGDFGLGECSAILKYLAEKTGSPAYPSGLQARARVNEAMDWFNTNFHRVFCTMTVYPHLGMPWGMDQLTRQGLMAFGEAETPRWLAVLDQHMLGDRAFVCGDEISLADYLGASYVTAGELCAFDFSPYPNVSRWISTMQARPGWGRAYAGLMGLVSALRMQAQLPA
jgi:glutathione S-transferase